MVKGLLLMCCVVVLCYVVLHCVDYEHSLW